MGNDLQEEEVRDCLSLVLVVGNASTHAGKVSTKIRRHLNVFG